uniref:Si:ch211-159i8.4 n=1 Tax=Salmo trutta TaxID=8032 RepID=A0A674B481_SALTR
MLLTGSHASKITILFRNSIDHFPQKRVTSGENFQVDCVASGLPDPEVSWSLPDGTMINNALQSDDSGTRSRRYVIFGNGTLLLQQMGKKDEGDYTCHAKNELGEDEMKVSVKVGPDFPRITSKAQLLLTARLGESAYMTCQAIGEPPPTIVWLSPSNDVITSSSTKYQILDDGTLVIKKVTLADQGNLELRGVRKTDEGQYVCLAKNHLGEASLAIDLEVASIAEKPSFAMPNIEILPIKQDGSDVTLECPARGKPNPEFVWILPNELIKMETQQLSLPAMNLFNTLLIHIWEILLHD